jgi:hypothetical protein
MGEEIGKWAGSLSLIRADGKNAVRRWGGLQGQASVGSPLKTLLLREVCGESVSFMTCKLHAIFGGSSQHFRNINSIREWSRIYSNPERS